ncbi:hypothetical protein CK489_31420 [Bradyrhizobium sp. UFLA03-84]|uniref:hypothetical protein n=1 Tax=Bradyrhizobium sp. UFLA03-84 TaxID=418599 RepID=UPI000BAE2781|nr:hypothetical protein [Bradyrhizobium sp. UFLA03-84]PAY05103.1 hypothetical protein CK489_31420 [Bradyrhizobium sp. UFLA03-84]
MSLRLQSTASGFKLEPDVCMIVAVTGRTAAGVSAPRRGDAIELRQNEAEIDVDLGRCNRFN